MPSALSTQRTRGTWFWTRWPPSFIMTGRGSSTSTATSPGTPLSIYYLHTACVELKSEQIARRGNHQGNALQRFEPALGLANRLWNRRDAPALLARIASSSAVQQKTPYPATRPHDQVSALFGAATPHPNDHARGAGWRRPRYTWPWICAGC